MTHHLKRINPFWHSSPLILAGIIIGGLGAIVGYKLAQPIISILGGVVAGVAVLLATRPAISAVLASLGLFGGMVTFILLPTPQSASLSVLQRIMSTGLFTLFYMVLMDALVIVISVLYNFFSGVVGLGGVRFDFETEEPAGEAGGEVV